MKKAIIVLSTFAVMLASSYAGDVAKFVDKGFSEDGRYYVFGQYGKTDEKYQGYAEIYQVDIDANDFVDKGVFKTKPSVLTAGVSGKDVYDALDARNFSYYRDLNLGTAGPDQLLYILDDVNKTGTDEIVFTDFSSSSIDNPNTYHVQLLPTVTGSGVNVKSSFTIMVEKQDGKGNLIFRKKVGSPDVVRKGVKNYKIERIFCDKSGTSFIFVIEKTMEDKTGTSIRYMVEAAKF